MVFSSAIFLVFFLPIVLVLYFFPVFKKINRKYKNLSLLLVSLGFYAWGEPVFIFVMLFSITVNFFLAKLIYYTSERGGYKQSKKFLVIDLVFNIGLLFVFKYLSFVAKNLNYLPFVNLPNIQIALPIGISFFSFQIMSYIFDVYYKKVPAQKSWSNLALYISLFPQLIAGPIVRYQTIESEILNRKENWPDIYRGIKRFIFGLAKKCLLANYMAIIADTVFNSEIVSLTTVNAWYGAIAYALQIYFDFSGYSDMAIGLGLIFGFHFEENFNYPYVANSITDFWRRWHISLSTWFRDYVYIPLGGSHCKKSRWIFNLSCVWILTGIWHGANWTYIVWGLYFLVLLLIEKIILKKIKNQFAKYFEKNKFMNFVIKFLSHFYAIVAIIVGWVIFRSTSLEKALAFLQQMFIPISKNNGTNFLINKYFFQKSFILFLIALFSAFPILKKLKIKIENFCKKNIGDKVSNFNFKNKFSIFVFYTVNILENTFIILIFILSILACIKSTYNPFIYFNF